MRSLLETRRVFVMVLALGLLTLAMRGVADPDVWWHLRTGELILQNHRIFHTDPYSFTRAGQPWVNHEWLSEIFIYGLYHSLGWCGLIVAFGLIPAAAFMVMFWRSPGQPYVAGLLTLWGAFAAAPTWGIRPQMFSFLLASVFLFILESSAEHPSRLWWTVPVLWLWVNLHAGYALGVIFLLVFLIGEVLNAGFGFESSEAAKRRLPRLALALAGCLAVVPINPNGLRMYWYPWETLSSRAMHSYIEEWFSPNFHEPQHWALLFLILAVIFAAGLAPRKIRPREYLLLALTLCGALRSVRHIPFFVLVAVPLLCEHVGWRLKAPTVSHHWTRLLVNSAVVVAYTAFTVFHARTLVIHQPALEAERFPSAAVSFLAHHRRSLAPVLNYYSWGGYLIWKLYPEYRVLIDGRADLYGDTFLDDLATVYYVRDGWSQTMRNWNIRTVILPPDFPLATVLRAEPGWIEIYRDPEAVVLSTAR
jgi:hypothetical protein